jgi:DNA-binding response OmpR family regulator
MKIMIVSSGSLLGEALKVVLADHFDEVVLTDHDQALESFLFEEPTHVLVSGMIGSQTDAQVVKDIRGANVSSRILAYGLDQKADIQFPLEKMELISILIGE